MKRPLILVTVVAACLLAGCVGQVKTYSDPGQAINIGVNQEFIIALDSNPTTGYSWQANYDETMLELVGGESTYKESKEAEEGMVGAGGTELFRFKALERGETKITMVYKRTWEAEILEQKAFTVNIK